MESQLLLLIVYLGTATGIAALVMAARELITSRGSSQTEGRTLRRSIVLNSAPQSSLLPRFDAWLEKMVYQSGFGISVTTASLIMLLAAILVGGAIYIVTDDLLWTLVAAAVTCWCCVLGLLIARNRRVRQFDQQFPNALDLMARAARSGESLEQAVELVARASKGPVGYEFRQCSKQMQMGLSITACMKSLAQRMDLVDVKIFAGTVSVHREMGGALATTLERLANVIRDRIEYRRHLKSVTGGGRFSIGIISMLGPFLFAYLFLVQREYGQNLWLDPIGKWMLVLAVVLQVIGLFWVSRVLKADY